MKIINMAGREISPSHPCFIVAEAGVNHDGSPEKAKRLVDAAARAGADAVKFQMFRTESLVVNDAPKAEYQRALTDSAQSQFSMLKALEFSVDAFRDLQAYCLENGIMFLASAFDEASLDALADLNVPAVKLASGELTNIPFLQYAARKGRPVILSTGMAYLEEVEKAVKAVLETGNDSLMLLHCTTEYPAACENVNLRAMDTLLKAFNLPVGFSDHTMGVEIALAAVARGAVLIEKHFTLDRNAPGPDHTASLEPDELKAMVDAIRRVEAALGDGEKKPVKAEQDGRMVARKSLVALRDLPAGTVIRREHLAAKRPATGISPSEMERVAGRRCKTTIKKDTLLAWNMLD